MLMSRRKMEDVVPKVEGGKSSAGTDESKTTVKAVTGVLDSAAVDSAAATGAGKALTGASVVTNLGRLKDFKLYGTIGDGKHCLGYGTICHRIEQGKAQGYPFEEILDVVIRSIEAGSQLQRYFDGHRKMPEAEFFAILKNHYNHEGYMKLLMQLGKGRQGPKEKTMDFVYRMTRLRDDIIAVAKDEGVTVDAEGVNKQCFYAISVGISSNTVRLELGNVLKNTSLKDFELFREVNAAVTREEEYLKLLEESKEVQAKTNNIQGGSTKGDDDMKSLVAEIRKLNQSNQKLAAKVEEVSVLREEVAEMKKAMSQGSAGGPGGYQAGAPARGPGRVRFRPKCEPCMLNNVRFCTHCAVCGKSGHKQKECPKE